MGENNEFKIKELIYENYAKSAKRELMQDLSKVVDGLSPSVFQPMTEVFLEDPNDAVDVEDFNAQFRKFAQKSVLSEFDQMWEEAEFTETLAGLECLRKEAPDKAGVQWRPTGKTPQEQLRPFVMKTLQKKFEYLNMQLQFQDTQLKECVPKLMEIQESLETLKTNRSVLTDLMKVHQSQTQESTELQKLSDKVDDLLDRIRE
ncbi:uncharacterized protein LOC132260344 [Phlebotomus argentipes]|uniref:uncharacterized protein LOC132260344 n=1 Tax=Phlebotomus argentipes TaxID=94469 RepID=UPI002892C898|nr:uncharacterized protein LOC132260344 [Phlebotomus argentipes]